MIDEKILLDSMERQDLELLQPFLPRVSEFIEHNPFSERMIELLHNQPLAQIAVADLRGECSVPNCIGTAFYVAGVSRFTHPYHGRSWELRPYLKADDGDSWQHMFFKHVERRLPGALILSPALESDDWHVGIYLGQIDYRHLAFSQHGRGGKFGPEIIELNYENPDYYLPKTLKIPNQTKTENPQG